MISSKQIDELARRYQTSEKNIRREYLQHVFLRAFYQQDGTDKIYFKGGMALRLIYRSPRFSEDLDFSAAYYDTRAIERIILQTLVDIQQEGITTDLVEAKNTTGGYLAKASFQIFDETIELMLQISLRATNKKGTVTTVPNDFILSYQLIQLSQDQLIDEKISALLNRQKPRDFYDLYYILRADLLSAKKKSVLPKVLTALEATKINFETELKKFLPKSHWAIIRELRPALKREIGHFSHTRLDKAG